MEDASKRLREAASAGSAIELKALLHEPGLDAWAKCKSGMTALMWAARNGREACLKLLLPVSDALAKDNGGMTALMWAAYGGGEACVSLLLPVSDALAQDKAGRTASASARRCGHKIVAELIDAYVLAQSEKIAIEVAVRSGSHRGRAALRV